MGVIRPDYTGKGVPGDFHPDQAQQGMINLQQSQLEQTVTNYQLSLQNMTNPEDIARLQADFQNIVKGLIGPSGVFRDQLKSVGITNPADIDAVVNSYLSIPGLDPLIGPTPDTNPVALRFIDELTVWENDTGRTPAEKQLADAILSGLSKTMTPKTVQLILSDMFTRKTLVDNKDIFAQFPGITLDDLLAIAAMLPGYSISMPMANIQPITPITPAQPPSFGYAGSARFIYENHSGRPDDQIYIQVVGTDPITNAQCFVKYNPDGTFKYIDVPLPSDMKSEDYANRLSDFTSSEGGRVIFLPPGGGMRLYTSIGSPVHMDTSTMTIGSKVIPCIIQPDPHNKDHPGFTMPWDKVEFNVDWGTLMQNLIAQGKIHSEADLNNQLLVSNIGKDFPNLGVVFINPTAVDGFSLPLFVDAAMQGGSLTQPGGSVLQEGGITSSPEKVFNDFNNNLKNIPSTGNPTLDAYIEQSWQRLFIGTGDSTRLLSPMDGSATGHFPPDFFTKTGWIDKFKTLFSASSMKIDMDESGGNGVWDMKINPATNELTFTNPGSPYSPITLKLPADTQSLLSGTGTTWGLPPPPDADPKIGLERALVRNLSVAIDTNTLTTQSFPLKDAAGKLILDSNGKPIIGVGTAYFKYMDSLGRLCSLNPEMQAAGGPQFFNPYSRAIHANAPDGQVYAGAYSDEEGRPGAAAQRISDFETGHIILGPMS